MEQDIKRLKEKINNIKKYDTYRYDWTETDVQTVEHLIKAYKEKDKDNNDLRRLYRRTAVKLRENGKEELADYFLAQINEVPTFVVDDDIDYYTEYYKLKEENKDLKYKLNSSRKANEKLSEKNRNLQIEKETVYSEAINNIIAGVDLDNSFIPVSLVEETIEERKLWLSSNDIGYKDDYVLEVLQELLEKRK